LLDVLLSQVAVFPEGTCTIPVHVHVVYTIHIHVYLQFVIPCTEDYGLEILFLECWSRASEMDFFEVQYDTHTHICSTTA
jgi:hypothetical protein